ncbi:hypothetical protein [Aetokthonos hydrillicola]|jgi:hypothetical protein|uniref:hypothetical protein n=1 Tax=Aetokthonos hydrillicola TaxID=1550245 RepID=UPI001AFD3FB7|nr:hypothetical protein [Aetokthonos hydrillicola CCALA 1050]
MPCCRCLKATTLACWLKSLGLSVKTTLKMSGYYPARVRLMAGEQDVSKELQLTLKI